MKLALTVPWLMAAVGLAAVGLVGCDDKKNGPGPAPTGSTSAAVAVDAAPPGPKTTKFVIDPKGSSTVDMPAPKLHIKAKTDGAKGSLDVALTDLAQTRGEVGIDLSTLTMSHFGNDDDKKETVHARCWLEAADCEDAKVADDVKAKNRWALYTIRTIDEVSASDVTKMPAQSAGGDDVRTVSLKAHGDLLIHGEKVDREAELSVELHYPPGGAADKPREIAIKTKKPISVVLAQHAVKPRDGGGKLAKDLYHLLGTKVADSADVTLDLRAAPQP